MRVSVLRCGRCRRAGTGAHRSMARRAGADPPKNLPHCGPLPRPTILQPRCLEVVAAKGEAQSVAVRLRLRSRYRGFAAQEAAHRARQRASRVISVPSARIIVLALLPGGETAAIIAILRSRSPSRRGTRGAGIRDRARSWRIYRQHCFGASCAGQGLTTFRITPRRAVNAAR